MVRSRIFISYDYYNDKNCKNLLLAWDKNKDFDFTFYDQSVDISVDSNDHAAIARVISQRIADSSHFLCLVGKHTHRSKWVAWEISKAKELKKKLVGVKIDRTNESPFGLLNAGARWALSFTFDSIKQAIEAA